MKKRAFLPIILVIAILFCGCVSNSPGSNSVSVTTPTITSQNPDDLYIQYIAEYEKKYDEMTKPLLKLEKGTNDYVTIKSTWMDIQVLSKTYYAKIEPLKVSAKSELSKNYYLESLKVMQQYSEASINAPYPQNPSNPSEYLKFDSYMTSQNSQIKTVNIYLDRALDSETCKLLLEKQNFTYPICTSKGSLTTSSEVNQTTNTIITPIVISETPIPVNPDARNIVLANPTRYCIGSSGYAEWREGRSVSGIFCIPYAQKNYPKCDVGTGPVVYGPNGIICGD